MGYRLAALGTINIEPPIPWGKVRQSPFRPTYLGGDEDMDVVLVIGEVEHETDQGILLVREATGVEQRYNDDPRNRDIEHHLQLLVEDFPGHAFTGRLDMEGEDQGDMWRLVINNVLRLVVRVDPIITWPDEGEATP